MGRISIRGMGLFFTSLLCLLAYGAPAQGQAGGGGALGVDCFDSDLLVVVLQPTKEKVPPHKIALPTPKDAREDDEKPVTFQVIQVLKGDLVDVGDFVEVAPSEPLDPKRPPHAWLGTYGTRGREKAREWGEAIPISATYQAYAEMLVKPMSEKQRLLECYRYWKTDDEEVRHSVDSELRGRYQKLLLLRTRIDHDFVVQRAQNDKLERSTRCLAFDLLAIGGNASDKEWLQAYIQGLPAADDPKHNENDCPKEAIFTYVALAGDEGVRWLAKEILQDSKSRRHLDAIFALRTHAGLRQFIPQEIALRGMRTALNAPQPPMFLIDELINFQDWTAVDRVAQIGLAAARKKEDPSNELGAALRYLFACPGLPATEELEEIKRLKPEVYEGYLRASREK